MFKYATRLAAVAAIVPISLALSAMPSHADTDQGVTLTGTATCNVATGHATWTLHWTIDNQASHEVVDALPRGGASPQSTDFDDITVESADESGLVTADILSAVTPNPVPAREMATATDGPVPNAVGDVTLDITWTNNQTDGANTATVHLDGSCVLPDVPTTVAPTTTTTKAPPAVKTAVVAKPAFTG